MFFWTMKILLPQVNIGTGNISISVTRQRIRVRIEYRPRRKMHFVVFYLICVPDFNCYHITRVSNPTVQPARNPSWSCATSKYLQFSNYLAFVTSSV